LVGRRPWKEAQVGGEGVVGRWRRSWPVEGESCTGLACNIALMPRRAARRSILSTRTIWVKERGARLDDSSFELSESAWVSNLVQQQQVVRAVSCVA